MWIRCKAFVVQTQRLGGGIQRFLACPLMFRKPISSYGDAVYNACRYLVFGAGGPDKVAGAVEHKAYTASHADPGCASGDLQYVQVRPREHEFIISQRIYCMFTDV